MVGRSGWNPILKRLKHGQEDEDNSRGMYVALPLLLVLLLLVLELITRRCDDSKPIYFAEDGFLGIIIPLDIRGTCPSDAGLDSLLQRICHGSSIKRNGAKEIDSPGNACFCLLQIPS